MDKKTRSIKNQVLQSIREDIHDIFTASEKAVPYVYRSKASGEHTETPGKYNSRLSRVVAHDILSLAILLRKDDEKAADELMDLHKEVVDRDLTLRRMFDDRKGNRPVVEYPFASSKELIERLNAVSLTPCLSSPFYAGYKELFPEWVRRILTMDVWAFAIRSEELIGDEKMQAEMRCADEKGQIQYGVSEEDEKAIKILLAMEQILIQALVRIPAWENESAMCLKRIEVMDTLVQAILTEDENTLAFLGKCVKAAEEFRSCLRFQNLHYI